MSVFKNLDLAEDVVTNIAETITKGIFTGNTGSLTTFFTSSTAINSQKQYYYEVFQTASVLDEAEGQFSVAYGHRLGSGSYNGGGQVNDAPTRAIYSQYRQLLMDAEETTYKFGPDDTITTDQIYAITFNRSRYKQRLDPGNVEISVAELTGSAYANNVFTGSNVVVSSSNKVVKLIDDSGDATQTGDDSKTSYNLVSGSISGGIFNSSSPHYYGKVYPSLGIAVIDAVSLNQSASFNSVTSSTSGQTNVLGGDNAFKLFTAISGAAVINSTLNPLTARSAEKVSSTHYFIRVKARDFNFSNNPTFTTGSDFRIKQQTFVNDPKTYITTVGLYDDEENLLAVAKLSKAVLKAFDREVLVKVRVDF